MSNIRVQHSKEKPYVILNKKALEDPKLSWSAKGLWAYLLSRPDNWVVSVSHLSKVHNGDKRGGGRDSIYANLKELIENGYAEAEMKKNKGKFSQVDYIIFEERQVVKLKEPIYKLKKRVPRTVKPDTVEPDTVKPTLTIKNVNNKEFIKNDLNVTNEVEKEEEEDRSLDMQESNVLFNPSTFVLPNGNPLSLQMKRSIAKYSDQDRQKLSANVAYFNEQVKKGIKIDNDEAYLQTCIKFNYAQKNTNSWQNRLYAQWFKEETKASGLKILKTVVQIHTSDSKFPESVSFSLPPESFGEALRSIIKKSKK